MKRTINDIKSTLQNLIISSSYFCPFQTSAQVNFTEINGSLLHSQYHPNPHSSFKGMIVFQNGTGSSLEAWSANKTFLECIKQVGNLFLYDRSGLGKSSFFTTDFLGIHAFPERPFRFFSVIEMQLFGANNLIVLMTFTRNQNKVSGPGRSDRLSDRDRSVNFHLVVDA